jgi:hypothetical protein
MEGRGIHRQWRGPSTCLWQHLNQAKVILLGANMFFLIMHILS